MAEQSHAVELADSPQAVLRVLNPALAAESLSAKELDPDAAVGVQLCPHHLNPYRASP
jgi:hypothetical protein